MSYIPDCRTNENYNEKYLNKEDDEFVAGYDWAVEQMLNLFDNLDVFPEFEKIMNDKIAIAYEGKADTAKNAVRKWMEMQRNELITSMIDGMDEEEYTHIKEKVDGSGKKENGQDAFKDGEAD